MKHNRKPRLEVRHPEHCETVRALALPPGNPTHYFIAVQGSKLGGIREIFGVMIDPARPKKPRFPSFAYQGSNWVLGFRLPRRTRPYILIVGAQEKKGDPPARWHSVVTVEFTVTGPRDAADDAAWKGAYGSIPVQFPINDTSVCPTFTACGLEPNPATSHATMGTTAGTKLPGTPLGVWMFQFTNVPLGDYTFMVDNLPGGDSSSVPDVTVDPAACLVIVGTHAPPPPP